MTTEQTAEQTTEQTTEQTIDNIVCHVDLSLAAINYILTALSEKPYKESASIILDIRAQVIPQVNTKNQ